MKRIYKETMFERNILVSERRSTADHAMEVIFSLGALFSIRVTSGSALAQKTMIPFISAQLGIDVPEPFYKGFPNSVRALSTEKLVADQVLHYFQTYGLGLFDEPGHSLFEPVLERTAFREQESIRDFTILTEDEAEARIGEIVSQFLMSTRPLSERQYALVREYIKDSGGAIEACASKNTAVRLLADTRNLRLTRFLSLSDVIRLVDEINYRRYRNENIRKLNLRNQDRKFITRVIDRLLESNRCDLETCCEKKALWCGLLHHLHYQPHDARSERFAACMRGRENLSVYSQFEKAMKQADVQKAVEVLEGGKGSAAVLRSLNRILSGCASLEEAEAVLQHVKSTNVIALLQLLLQYAVHTPKRKCRNFVFTRYNRMKVHIETPREVGKRRSVVRKEYAEAACRQIRENIRRVLQGRLGKVYIDPDMQNIALPLQENTSQGGFGVLSRGSRIRLEKGKKIRAFTYWEKVNDIDLSVIGLNASGEQTEFSWRTMSSRQFQDLTFSGDQTSGYDGGSEYFDVDAELFRLNHPDIRYLIFCNNVYSGSTFSKCICRAGFMLRDIDDSGEVFEPKTVQSSYSINCESTFAYLFALDLEKREFVWLNTARESHARVAGNTSVDFLNRYFEITSVINMYTFFEMMAEEMVENPSEADVIVSDRAADARDGAEIIRSCDFEKVLAYLNA